MTMEERQRELVNPGMRHERAGLEDSSGHKRAGDDPSDLPFMAKASELVLGLAEECEESVAGIAHDIRCLRAARGGTGGTSQTAAAHLAHPRLKSTPLEDAYTSLQEGVARSEEVATEAVAIAVKRILELEIQRASLRRCELAVAQRRESKIADQSGVLAQARRVVAQLSRLGVAEGHWSTVSRPTIEKIFALIMADNIAAEVGSPSNPKMDWKRNQGDR
jgi:hypothetical protein